MGSVCSNEAQVNCDAAALAAVASGGVPSSSSSACDTLLAKLDELMDYLRFAKLPTATFHGVVTFMFRASDTDKHDIACIRTVDMRNDLIVLDTALAPTDPFASHVAVVHVTLADFLFMYSGDASAAEIASLCLSGRVGVAWRAYSQLKSFAESFDFSTEKWDAYYLACHDDASRNDALSSSSSRTAQSLPLCVKACCRSSSREAISADWLLVADATSATSATDWQVVTDSTCIAAMPQEQRVAIENAVGPQQLDAWVANLWRDHIQRSHTALQTNVRKSLHDLKQLTGKLFVSMEA